MKTSKKNYLNEFTNNKNLAKKVLKQINLSWSELIERPGDFRNADSGVSGFIYYTETVKFAKNNMVLIQNAINDLEKDTGHIDKPTKDETQYYNWLAWFALETVVHEIMQFVEDN